MYFWHLFRSAHLPPFFYYSAAAMTSSGLSSPRNVRRYGQVKVKDVAGWLLVSFITKAGDGRASLSRVHDTHVVFILNPTRIHTISPYIRVSQVFVGAEVGIIECLTISRSVNEIKKLFRMTFLTDFFERCSGIFPRPRDSSLGHRSFTGPPPPRPPLSTTYTFTSTPTSQKCPARSPVPYGRGASVWKGKCTRGVHGRAPISDESHEGRHRGRGDAAIPRPGRFRPGLVQFYRRHDLLGT